jgi:hypothetical protein
MSRPDDSGTIIRALVEARAVLDAWSTQDWSDGLQLDTLPALRSLIIRTRNNDYRLTVIDGVRGDVLVTGGKFFPTPTRARLNGATLGGSVIKSRGVYCGFRLEFQFEGQTIVTTRVKKIELAGEDAGAVH